MNGIEQLILGVFGWLALVACAIALVSLGSNDDNDDSE